MRPISSQRGQAFRGGWTMLELVVVVAIAFILISLSLIAVQQARESSRRLHCQGNLVQTSFCLQAFHDAEKELPSLYNKTSLTYPVIEWDLFHMHSWRVMLLPYSEQNAIYEKIDWNKLATAEENLPVGQTAVPLYLCPSSGSPSQMGQGLKHERGVLPPVPFDESYYYRVVRSDYDAMAGIQFLPDPLPQGTNPNSIEFVRWGIWGWPIFDKPEISGTKMFSYHRGKFAHVTDGLSNTIMVTERGGKPIEYRQGKPHYTPDNPKAEYPGQTGWSASNTFAWSIHRHGTGVNYDNSQGPYSMHPGGANVAIADGSVHFLSDKISFDTLVSLYGRADGGLPFDPANP